MKAPDTGRSAAIYREACALDVQAFKPGNVSLKSSGHGMQAADFLRSAEASAAAIVQPHSTLGQRIYNAVAATRRRVGCNTNLGIVLLAAPLLQASHDHPGLSLREALRLVLAAASLADAEEVYRAIRLAAPGGLGERLAHDVAQPARLPLAAAMREAAGHDLIARQYANGFAELFDDIQPYLGEALVRHQSIELALTDAFLYVLAHYPDSHIRRKFGERVARRVQQMARATRQQWYRQAGGQAADSCLARLDSMLKARGLNPGTSADLCVAAVISYRLQQPAIPETGASSPEILRTARPQRVGVPLSTTSQRLEGDKKWQRLQRRLWVKPWWAKATRSLMST